MIILDWKERFEADIKFFCDKRLKEKDNDIGIIYNAYPSRINREIPEEVLIFIAKKLAKYLTKSKEDYFDFYMFLWNKKSLQGKIILSQMFCNFLKKDSSFFYKIEDDFIKKVSDAEIVLIFDKTLCCLFKKNIKDNIDILLTLISHKREVINKKLEKLTIRLIKKNEDIIDYIID